MSNKKWYEKSYRRSMIDMHVDDWDEKFLSEFDPENYVRLLKTSNIQSTVIPAVSHVGKCFWPAKTGKVHDGLKGKDLFGTLIELCHKEGIDVVAYYSTIFNNWAYESYPSWRMVNIDGQNSRDFIRELPVNNIQMARYGNLCPNAEGYREFTFDQIKEIVSNYNFEGMWLDMPFWTMVCYCDNCKKLYREECDREIPKVIDWNDPEWLCFQKKREEWMAEYEKMAGEAVKNIKPGITITYNFAPATSDWLFGITEKIGAMSDYCTGDQYGGLAEQSFICKLYKNISGDLPFEFITSSGDPSLGNDHTTKKGKDMLKLHTYISMAHNGAFLFVDAVDPMGTLDSRVYELMRNIFSESKYYESYLGGKMLEDVAIYFSFNSKMSFCENEVRAKLEWGGRILGGFVYPHLEAVTEVSNILKENHVPYGVVSKKQIKSLNDYKVLIAPGVIMMDEEEEENILSFVEQGGSLYISGAVPQKLLESIFEIKNTKITEEKTTYMAPSEAGQDLFSDFTRQSPLYAGPQVIADPEVSGIVLAEMVLPYTNPGDQSKFASIHSNPPGRWTQYPSIIYGIYGKGKVIWASFPIETIKKELHKKIFINMVKKISNPPFSYESDAPKPVEITIFHQPENKRYIINLINEQENHPPIPVYDFNIRLNVNGRKILKIKSITYGNDLDFLHQEVFIEIKIPLLEIFNMISVEYE